MSKGTGSHSGSLWRKLPSARQGTAFFLVSLLSAVFFRRFILDSNDPNKCKALVKDGLWHDDHNWLTRGCSRDFYGDWQIRDCAAGRKFVFVGDWEVQWLYWATLQKLDGGVAWEPVEGDIRHSKDKVEMEFVWDPYLNSSKLHEYVDAYRNTKPDRPMLTVLGAGQWHIENDAESEFVHTLETIANTAYSSLSPANLGSKSFSIEDGPGDLLLFAPVQEPYNDNSKTSPETAPYKKLNAHLARAAGENVLWSFAQMTAGRQDKYFDDSPHVQDEVSRARADVLLNLRCNAKAAKARGFPNIRVCCGTWAGPNWIQSIFLFFGLAILPAVVLLDYRMDLIRSDIKALVQAMCAFTSTISLQYITDRTHIFEQVTRLHLELPNLRNMVTFILLLGLVSIRRSRSLRKLAPGEKQPDQPFLPRDQTDEWKGWMQALIIVYHYNMAWSADWFWEIIRLAVGSYLFLTGFGHTIFFLQKRDYSFRRFAAVMIRTNLLPVTLAYVMRTRWLLYYYMPLSTFWFLVVYATLAIGSSYNQYTAFVLAKILASAALVRAFLGTNDLAETLVRLFSLTCNISFNARDFFYHRVKIDQYIVYVGMVAAMVYIFTKDVLASDRRQDTPSRVFRRVFPLLKPLTIIVAAISFVGFWLFTQSHIESQHDFEGWQPYISFIPILSFTILRNAHPYLRNFHSAAFAWLGRYSGEMYVMQDHIWLAGDQEAVLRTGLFHGDETVSHDRWRDLLLITPLYLIACALIGDATTTIATYFVKEEASPAGQLAATDVRQVSEVEMGLLSGDRDDDAEGRLGEKHHPQRTLLERWKVNLWPRKVSNRALLVLGLMWLLNMTYT